MKPPGRQVGTVGRFEIEPNAPNVIPGMARFTIGIRDLSMEKLAGLVSEIRARAQQIASDTRTTITIEPLSRNPPAIASPDVQRAIERAADALSLGHARLPSGAGHDAQMMAQLSPMGMIFVPSVGGISHARRSSRAGRTARTGRMLFCGRYSRWMRSEAPPCTSVSASCSTMVAGS